MNEREQVAELHRQRLGATEIAERLGIDRGRVYRALVELRQRQETAPPPMQWHLLANAPGPSKPRPAITEAREPSRALSHRRPTSRWQEPA